MPEEGGMGVACLKKGRGGGSIVCLKKGNRSYEPEKLKGEGIVRLKKGEGVLCACRRGKGCYAPEEGGDSFFDKLESMLNDDEALK